VPGIPILATLQAFRSGDATIPLEGGGTLQAILTAAGATTNPQPASLQGTLLLDPQNFVGGSGGVPANDASPPTATVQGFTGPLFKSYAGIAAAWGTLAPRLSQDTTIVGLSSHTDFSDPIVWLPICPGGVTPAIQGAAPALVGNVVLGGTVAKSRAAGANSLLQTNVGGAGALGLLLENTTAGKSSRAWLYKALGAGAFSLTQPMVKSGIKGTTVPAEVDTWANGDTVNLLKPIALNVVQFQNLNYDANATFNNFGHLYQLAVLDPGAAGPGNTGNQAFLSGVRCIECDVQRSIVNQIATQQELTVVATNCAVRSAVDCNALAMFGGAAFPSGQTFFVGSPVLSAFDGDVILGNTGGQVLTEGATFGLVFLDSGVSVLDGILLVKTFAYGSHVIYGSGANTINMQGCSHLGMIGGTFAAAFTAPGLVTGVQLNGTATASSYAAGTWNAGITTTPAHLDAAAGAAGFGGNAISPGGASCSNFQ